MIDLPRPARQTDPSRSSRDGVRSPEDVSRAVEEIGSLIDDADRIDRLLDRVLSRMLDLFGCDRAWLLHPCNPDAPSWRVPMERTHPEWPGALAEGAVVPMDDGVRELFRDALSPFGPRRYDPEARPLPQATEPFSVRSQMVHAIRPRLGQPWLLGIHHCAGTHVFREDEERLFEGIGRRMTDALSALLSVRDLRDTQRRFRELTESLGDVIWSWEPGVGFQFLSPAFSEIWGRPERDARRTPWGWLAWVHARDRGEVVAALRAGADCLEFRICRPDGELRWVRTVFQPVLDEFGGYLRTTGVAMDMTARRDEEAARIERAQHLARAERLATVGTLAAGLSHEINNPLASLMATLSRARERAGGLSHAEVERALAAAGRIAGITGRLSAFARPRSAEHGPVDLSKALASAVALSRNEIRHRGTLHCEIEADLRVHGAETDLVQVFLNLLLNAGQALASSDGEEGRVELLARSEGGRVLVEVRDSGPGMAPELLERIFDPFFTTRDVGMGTGLGLSVSHGIVESHGGSIEVESEPGRGTTVRVWLPRVAFVGRVVPGTDVAGGAPDLRRWRVLLVDDDESLLEVMQEILEPHDVDRVSSGRDAIERICHEAYDVVVCDVMMPGTSGLEVYRCAVTHHPELAGRFVFITGGIFDDDIADQLRLTGRPCLDKPFMLEDFLGEIERAAAGDEAASARR